LALKQSSRGKQGIDIFFVVDLSRSMDSPDVKPSRLARVKRALFYLTDRLANNRLGIVSFAGVAFISCPLTSDTSAIKLLIDAMNTQNLPVPGTDMGNAIALALQSFQRTGAKHSALILLTDGENFGRGPLTQIEQAADEGVRTFCLGVGTPEGSPVPLLAGQSVVQAAKVVLTKLNENELKHLALQGSGTYVRLTSGGQEEEAIINELNKLEKIELFSEQYLTWQDYYPLPAGLAIVLLIFDMLMDRRRGSRWPWRWRLPWRKAGPAALLLLCWGLVGQVEAGQDQALEKGVAAFKRRNFILAEKRFEEIRKLDPDNPMADYNLGCAVLAQYRYQEAYQAFTRAHVRAQSTLLRDSWYNLGYTAFYLGVKQGTPDQWMEAAEDYKQCLLVDPHDDDARYNLELILREIRRHTQSSVRQEQQSQGQKDGTNPGGGADRPGSDRIRSEARENDQANPGEAEKPQTKKQNQGNKPTLSEQQQGHRQKGMSEDDAMRTLKSLESEESSIQKDCPPGSADEKTYQGPDW
jgi:Ca-activated chloride channel family protein